MFFISCLFAGPFENTDVHSIYCEGDSLANAQPKPKVIYKEVPGSKIEIANMPAIRRQNMGECKAYATAAVLQKYTCDRWADKIKDCSSPPPDVRISYFGLTAYTNAYDLDNWDKALYLWAEPSSKEISIYNALRFLKENSSKFFLDDCVDENKLFKTFSPMAGNPTEYFAKLKEKYESWHKSEATECPTCLTFLNDAFGAHATPDSLSKALRAKTFDHFLYSLLFGACKMKRFPGDFSLSAYPYDNMDVTPADVKANIVTTLSEGHPVLLSSICLSMPSADGTCLNGHATVIAGYKKVSASNVENPKEVFKIHNSWGAQWQKENNDGWVDADLLMANLSRVRDPKDGKLRISSASIIWLH